LRIDLIKNSIFQPGGEGWGKVCRRHLFAPNLRNTTIVMHGSISIAGWENAVFTLNTESFSPQPPCFEGKIG
jgi:hypothetical protein